MTAERAVNVTRILKDATAGDADALNALVSAVYDDLRALAARHLQRERPDHTLQATAIVHEAYLKLVDQRAVEWRDRAHFFSVASRIIRRILVDHARGRGAVKRGGDRQKMTLDGIAAVMKRTDIDLVALDEALERLAEIDQTQARIVEMRFFAGLSIEEVAEVLGIGKRSVDREWSCAKAWLFRELTCGGDDSNGDEP